MSKNTIKVMIIDDSLSMRLFLKSLIHSQKDMEVIAVAEHPLDALKILKTITPDVITLDVEMPHMDGITFLKKLMGLKPIPTVMLSTLTQKGSKAAVEALEHGAIEVVGKPSHKATEMHTLSEELLEKIRFASVANVGQQNASQVRNLDQLQANYTSSLKAIDIDDLFPKRKTAKSCAEKAIAIGSSTGGPAVLKTILTHIPKGNVPPIFIVQHIGANFAKPLAESLNKISELNVVSAREGMPVEKDHVYIPPGEMHLQIERTLRGGYICKLSDKDKINRHKASVDVLFRSFSEHVGASSLAILLTGMGNDGAKVLKELYDLGAKTMVQSEPTCAVYGMPKVAIQLEPQHLSLTPDEIIRKIKEYSS